MSMRGWQGKPGSEIRMGAYNEGNFRDQERWLYGEIADSSLPLSGLLRAQGFADEESAYTYQFYGKHTG